MRRIIPLILALAIVLIPSTANAAEKFRSDSASYNGSYSALGFSTFGNVRLYTLKNVRATVELPRQYRNSFCAYAVVGINGLSVAYSERDCDTNGDATLTFRFHDNLYASAGDYVDVWISDPVTRYRITHPSIRL